MQYSHGIYSEGFCLPNIQNIDSPFPKKMHVLEHRQFYTGIGPTVDRKVRFRHLSFSQHPPLHHPALKGLTGLVNKIRVVPC